MAGYSAAALELMLDVLSDRVGEVSLHYDDPGETGAHELAGGAPLYTRQQPEWLRAVDDRKVTRTPLSFEVPAGATVRFYGLWSASGLTFYGSAELPPETFTRAGVYRLDLARLILQRKG